MFSIFRPHGSACTFLGSKECQFAFYGTTYVWQIYIYIYKYEKSTIQLASVGLAQARPNDHICTYGIYSSIHVSIHGTLLVFIHFPHDTCSCSHLTTPFTQSLLAFPTPLHLICALAVTAHHDIVKNDSPGATDHSAGDLTSISERLAVLERPPSTIPTTRAPQASSLPSSTATL